MFESKKSNQLIRQKSGSGLTSSSSIPTLSESSSQAKIIIPIEEKKEPSKLMDKKKNNSTANLHKWKPTVSIKINADDFNNALASGSSSIKNAQVLL